MQINSCTVSCETPAAPIYPQETSGDGAMKWLDSGLPALLGIGFVVAFADTAIEEGSIGAAWIILGHDMVRWACIAVMALIGWFGYRIIQKARQQP
jgi:hypothetical protein